MIHLLFGFSLFASFSAACFGVTRFQGKAQNSFHWLLYPAIISTLFLSALYLQSVGIEVGIFQGLAIASLSGLIVVFSSAWNKRLFLFLLSVSVVTLSLHYLAQ